MIRPLTAEQRAFAARHHKLIYAFLNRRRLPESEYYDVVVFGYNVADYCSNHYFRPPRSFTSLRIISKCSSEIVVDSLNSATAALIALKLRLVPSLSAR